MKKFFNYILVFICSFFIVFEVFALKQPNIEINSNNAIVVNLNNDEVIFDKNKDDVINIASMQKIMTTIVAIENINNYEESFDIDYGMFDGLDPELAMAGFYEGETVTYNDLLYATMLRSGADAAYALAIKISGSEEAYVDLMNKKAVELGMKNSVFKNTTGLDAEGQHSSVTDVAILLEYSVKNDKFKEIISKEEYTTTDGEISFDGPSKAAHAIGMDYYNGGKTGYTDLAGKCLASFGTKNGVSFVVVTALGDASLDNVNYIDTKTLFDYYINNYSFRKIINKNDTIKTLSTKYDEDVIINAKRNVELYLNNEIKDKDIRIIYEGTTVLDRSIKKGDKIGTYYIKYNDDILYQEDVLSPITVKFKLKMQYKIVLGLILLGIFIRLVFLKKGRKKRRKRI